MTSAGGPIPVSSRKKSRDWFPCMVPCMPAGSIRSRSTSPSSSARSLPPMTSPPWPPLNGQQTEHANQRICGMNVRGSGQQASEPLSTSIARQRLIRKSICRILDRRSNFLKRCRRRIAVSQQSVELTAAVDYGSRAGRLADVAPDVCAKAERLADVNIGASPVGYIPTWAGIPSGADA